MDGALKRAWPWLEAALNADSRPLWTMDGVKEELQAKRAHLWMGDAAAIVTTITDYESVGERALEGWLAGGDMEEIKTMVPIIENWARGVGCTQSHLIGRRGWARAFAPQGYSEHATFVRKLLT